MTITVRRPLAEMSELAEVIPRLLQQVGMTPVRVERIERAGSVVASSFPLEELTVHLDNGKQVELLFKNVNPRMLSAEARRAKPEFLNDPLREIAVYDRLLQFQPLDTPLYYGSVVDELRDQYWLFLEKVKGRELYQVGDVGIWQETARWLAKLHACFVVNNLPPDVALQIQRYDSAYYAHWLERAREFAAAKKHSGPSDAEDFLIKVSKKYDAVIHQLLELPHSLIHGEFYPSNVIVAEKQEGIRICAIDWERAAIGPGLIDVAALTAGKWSEERKAELALAYHDAQFSHGVRYEPKEFLRGLNLCRLHLAIQWLGWSANWSPPPDHRQNWLAEAVQMADFLGIN